MSGDVVRDIPAGDYRYESRPVFVRYPRGDENVRWCVLGPANMVRLNEICQVYQYSDLEYRDVNVVGIVARRNVKKRDGSTEMYVIAVFDNVVTDVDEEHGIPTLTGRCPSCEHLCSYHQPEGCWFTVTVGTPHKDTVCPCAVSRDRQSTVDDSGGEPPY